MCPSSPRKRYGPRRHDWERIDRVLFHMVPQGFTAPEVSQCVGVDAAQVRRRAAKLGIPFSPAQRSVRPQEPKPKKPRKRKRGPALVRVETDNATKRAYKAAMAANAILALMDQLEMASTWWEREPIKRQIKELGSRVTG